MSNHIHLDQGQRRMSFHQTELPFGVRHRGLSKFVTSASVFALTISLSGSLNSPQGFSPASAAISGDSTTPAAFADLAAMNDEALDQARGGFNLGNINLNVGVKVETAIDGFATITTNFNVAKPGVLQNLGTEVRTITEAAANSANAAIAAAHAAVEAAQNAAAVATGAIKPTKIGDVTSASQILNGASETTSSNLQNNPAVTQAMDTLNQGAKALAADFIPDSTPPATPQTGTTSTAPVISLIASSDAASGTRTVETSALAKDGNQLTIPSIGGNMAQVIHDTTNGHTSIITNSMNNVSIRQSVSMNMTIDNFTALQTASTLNRMVSSMSQQIGLLGLR
ncbi:hypothetical protein [Govanella unica]|uniref:Uncharacterized protein n=1 Tax=Govanella unica TaxID=2975056 RepID=A0A9X3U150_9PROT|nr:hypothetical protein [Govania unica]MDA5194739.1 hypothetical protein [Govania unica]